MPAATLHIEGMSCGHCLNAVSRALNAVPGVEVKSVQIGRAELSAPTAVAIEAAASAVRNAGYPATPVAHE